jgi:ABC-type multidrug transport system permease subunit
MANVTGNIWRFVAEWIDVVVLVLVGAVFVYAILAITGGW